MGYSAWGCKESDTIDQLTLSFSLKHKACTKVLDVQAWAEYVVVWACKRSTWLPYKSYLSPYSIVSGKCCTGLEIGKAD